MLKIFRPKKWYWWTIELRNCIKHYIQCSCIYVWMSLCIYCLLYFFRKKKTMHAQQIVIENGLRSAVYWWAYLLESRTIAESVCWSYSAWCQFYVYIYIGLSLLELLKVSWVVISELRDSVHIEIPCNVISPTWI